MEIKEKALSRVSVYKHKVSGSMPENLAHNHGKQCALIETEEIINLLDSLCGSTWKDNKGRTRSFTYEARLRIKDIIRYNQEVKAQIEKI